MAHKHKLIAGQHVQKEPDGTRRTYHAASPSGPSGQDIVYADRRLDQDPKLVNKFQWLGEEDRPAPKPAKTDDKPKGGAGKA